MQEQSQRLTKSELEEDRFLEWLMHAVEVVQQKWQLFVAGVVGVIAVALAINYALGAQEANKEAATGLLGEVLIAETNGQEEQAIKMAEQLIRTYAGTPAAAQGMLVLANRYYLQGRYQEAEQQYQRYLSDYGDTDILVYGAWSGLAACFEAQGDLQKAAAKYREYATKHAGAEQTSLALMEAARCYGMAGDKQTQKELLQEIVRDYAESPVAPRAREELDMF